MTLHAMRLGAAAFLPRAAGPAVAQDMPAAAARQPQPEERPTRPPSDIDWTFNVDAGDGDVEPGRDGLAVVAARAWTPPGKA
jgi:hypothetical protein